MNTFFISLGMDDTINKINDVISSSASGNWLDSYNIIGPNGKRCTVLVYEKYFYRVKNYVTLTIVLDEFDGKTRVHIASGGGGNGLLNLDWGASESFASEVLDELAKYKI